jgi:hypothetical protein
LTKKFGKVLKVIVVIVLTLSGVDYDLQSFDQVLGIFFRHEVKTSQTPNRLPGQLWPNAFGWLFAVKCPFPWPAGD